ncbi:MAG: hypothetical protein LBT36_02540 [Oscillospiraceae bacterium]|jgi:predicted Fe-Mo cluster-binding NifX family protein|nr:hypothetical protein [Oscillospiraceae bacterium]
MTYKIAVGTVDGVTVTEHFGRARAFFIYETDRETDETRLVEKRVFDADGELAEGGEAAHSHAAARLEAVSDCQLVLVAKIGYRSEKQLTLRGIVPLQNEGPLEPALARVRAIYKRRRLD